MTKLHEFTEAQKDAVSHIALDLMVGLGWLLMADHRTSSPGYNPAKQFLASFASPIRIYGAALLVVTLIYLAGVLLRWGTFYAAGRIMLAGFWAFFAGTFVVSFIIGDASPLAPAWGILWAVRTARLPWSPPWLPRSKGNGEL